IDEAVSQGDAADDVLRQVRRHVRVPFWPGDPDAPIPRDGDFPSGEPCLQVRPRPNERVDEVDGAVQALPNRHPLWETTKPGLIPSFSASGLDDEPAGIRGAYPPPPPSMSLLGLVRC